MWHLIIHTYGGVVWCGMMWCGVMWFGVVCVCVCVMWCDVVCVCVWCDVMWCGVVCVYFNGYVYIRIEGGESRKERDHV